MNENAGMFDGNSWWVILVLFFLFGGGAWNNNSQANMSEEFIKRDIFNTNTNVSAQGCATQKEVLENRYANQIAECATQKEILLGNANIQKDVLLGNQTLGANMASCCCELKTAIHAEGEATRDLINQNTIQNLRDQVRGYELVSALGNQTNTLTARFGTFFPNPPYISNYQVYGTTIA